LKINVGDNTILKEEGKEEEGLALSGIEGLGEGLN
jgi:hypothetical protein